MRIQALTARWNRIALVGAVALGCTIGARLFGHRIAFSQSGGAPEDTPVVLELFTSEGCSSCPLADELLSRIGLSATGVIPLAYHVDYWDRLGWSDPFSSGQWTARQVVYIRAMELGGPYTPQIVIGGKWECVGSDSPRPRARHRGRPCDAASGPGHASHVAAGRRLAQAQRQNRRADATAGGRQGAARGDCDL